MKRPADAARLLRESNPVADDAFAGAAGDSLGRATFERIIDVSAEPAQVTGPLPGPAPAVLAGRRGRRCRGRGRGGRRGARRAAQRRRRPRRLRRERGEGRQQRAERGRPRHVRADDGHDHASPRRGTRRPRPPRPPPRSGPTATSGARSRTRRPGIRSTTRASAPRPATPWSATRGGPGHASPDWAARLRCQCQPVRAAASRVSAAVPLLFQPGLPATGSCCRFAAFDRGQRPCAPRSPAEPWTWLAGSAFDGVEAIELTSRPDSPISETIWVSPGTYLPVRVVIRSAPAARGRARRGPRQTADFTWLPPTTQNLAKLTVPIPAGFRQVRLAEAVLADLAADPAGAPGPAAGFRRRPGMPGRPAAGKSPRPS